MKPRNVVDKYREWTVDLIREDVQKSSFPYAVLMENWQGDFNLGTLIRNANAFGAKEVFYIGKKKWDRRGAVGVYHYSSINYLSSYDEFLSLQNKYSFVGIDNIEGSVSIDDYVWPENPLFIFGEEGCGLTPETIKLCNTIVKINQYGSVRSLNAGTASGIVMYDFVNKRNKCLMKM